VSGDWKKRGDTYTKRVGGLKLKAWPHAWTARLDDGHLRSRFVHPPSLLAAPRAAERFVERLRKAVTR
jgi:hypothetical protein